MTREQWIIGAMVLGVAIPLARWFVNAVVAAILDIIDGWPP